MKKYTARSEQDAIQLVKNDLGPDALVLNIKKVQPKGLRRLFKKPVVEVTAAFDDAEKFVLADAKPARSDISVLSAASDAQIVDKQKIAAQQLKINKLERALDDKENLLKAAANLLSVESYHEKTGLRKYESNMIQIFYDSLIAQGVTGEIARELLSDVAGLSDPSDLPVIVKVVYNNIIGILGLSAHVSQTPRGVYFFLGPTGVGKTTTIAKLSSRFVFDSNVSVGLITADTYRIAAVEQLKTYAEILGVDIAIVYSASDLREILPKMQSFQDAVLIDTAGRSHTNAEMVADLKDLLAVAADAHRFLVLSLTTKYEDLLAIVKAYETFTGFDIIFTKADETVCLGSILNICKLTGKKISYITNGQNVPDDIGVLKPEDIAKSLMGLGGVR